MVQLFLKKDGAISIFLTIILVPVLVVSFLFVDASRIRLGKGVVSSAGDLTLNTVLTQYDPILNDYYGLLASSQDIDSFLATADEYFMACITSQGVEAGDARKYADQVMRLLTGSGGEISDLLQIEAVDGEKFTVSVVENGNLENAALVKKEIVEFMKYRAPIEAVAELFEKFQGSAKDLQDAEDNADLVDKKQKYYEKEGEVVEQALEVYKILLNYKNLNITKESVEEMKNTLNGLKEKYKSFHIKMVKDLYNTQDLTQFNVGYINVSYVASLSEVSINQPNSYINNAAQSISEFVTAANNLQNVYETMPEYNSGTMYDIQYWEECDEILNQNNYYSAYVSKANSMIKNIENLKTVMGQLDDEEKDENYTLYSYANTEARGSASRNTHYVKLLEQYNSLKTSYITNTYSAFWVISERLSTISSANMSNIKTFDVDSQIQEICNNLNSYYKSYDDALEYLSDAVSELRKLKKKVADYSGALEDWSDAADSYDTSMAEMDQEEIENPDTLASDIQENVTEDSIQQLIDRLNNIKTLLGGLKKGIDEYQYNGTSVRKIRNYDDFRRKSGVKESEISYITKTLREYAEGSFIFDFSDILSKNEITDKNNPALSVNTPKLYNWMVRHFREYEIDPDKVDDGIDSGKKQYDEKKNEKVENSEIGYFGSENEIRSLGNLPSTGYSGENGGSITKDIGKVSEFVSGLFSNFSKTVGGALIDARDSIFTLEYVMKMFSYDTYEYETKYKHISSDVNLSNYSNLYNSVPETWNEEAKTLTNKLINSTNNYSYGNEVEYIIYGKSNKENKDAAYGTVYSIRYVLDLFPMFTRYFGNERPADKITLDRLAEGVQTATQGIVPAALFKIVVVLGLTAGEAARDIQYLSKGMPVKLVKQSDDIEYRYGEVVDKGVSYEDSKSAFFYSDYIKLILMLKLNSSSEYAIYARIADVIQANMSNGISSGFLMKNANVYYSATAALQVKPLMLRLPIVSNSGYGSPENGGWNTITYKSIRGY